MKYEVWSMNYAADWAAEWGMFFNAEKSEHIAITTRKSDISSPHVTWMEHKSHKSPPTSTQELTLATRFPGTNMSTKFTRPVLEE